MSDPRLLYPLIASIRGAWESSIVLWKDTNGTRIGHKLNEHSPRYALHFRYLNNDSVAREVLKRTGPDPKVGAITRTIVVVLEQFAEADYFYLYEKDYGPDKERPQELES